MRMCLQALEQTWPALPGNAFTHVELQPPQGGAPAVYGDLRLFYNER
jgi:hypothetical protein